jgi:hypothetical protein
MQRQHGAIQALPTKFSVSSEASKTYQPSQGERVNKLRHARESDKGCGRRRSVDTNAAHNFPPVFDFFAKRNQAQTPKGVLAGEAH